MLENVPAAIGHALTSIRPGLGKLVYARDDLAAPETLRVTSDAFRDGEPILARHTQDGARVSPPLRFAGVPETARSLALVVEDADSPTPAPLVHALVWDIPAEENTGFQEAALDAEALPTTRAGASFGKNSFYSAGWLPPDPPVGHGVHRYCFQVFALDGPLGLEEGSGKSAFIKVLKGRVLAKGMLIGTYERIG